jgi:hypothetical protein
MFIRIIWIVGWCGLSSIVSGQDSLTLFPWVENGVLCQINSDGALIKDSTLTQVLYPTYSILDEFKMYENQGLYGFKDKKGQIIIKAGYEKVGRFREGFAWVKLDYKRFYYIDEAEKPLIDFTFDRCFDFQNGLARVFDKSKIAGNNGFGYINQNGAIAIALQYKKGFDFVNGHALIQEQNGEWWIIDTKGTKIQGPCLGLKARKNTFYLEK